MADREFFTSHNVILNLNTTAPGAELVSDCLQYFSRSRVKYAVTELPSMSRARLIEFWSTISYDGMADPPMITASVAGQQIAFCADDLRQILHLGTRAQENGPTCYPQEFINGALTRMGYCGSRTEGQFHKGHVYGQWRFLFHVMITVFGSRPDTLDELSPELLSALLSLVFNKPFSFGNFLFGELRTQISTDTSSHFMLYPRFCTLVIRHFLHSLPSVAGDFSVDTLGIQVYQTMFQGSEVRAEEFLSSRPLFGHLIDPSYDVFVDDEPLESDDEIYRRMLGISNDDTDTDDRIPDSLRIDQLESRLEVFESRVQSLINDMVGLANTVTLQNRAYSMLLQTHIDETQEKDRQIEELRRMVLSLQHNLSSQGEIGSTSRPPE